jgi:hypothetical protein
MSHSHVDLTGLVHTHTHDGHTHTHLRGADSGGPAPRLQLRGTLARR